MKVTEVIETFYFLKTFLISVNTAISSYLLHFGCANIGQVGWHGLAPFVRNVILNDWLKV